MIRVVVRIFASGVCIALTLAAWNYLQLQQDTAVGKGIFGTPPWVAEVIIPIAFALMSFHFVILVIQGISDVIRGTDTTAPGQDMM